MSNNLYRVSLRSNFVVPASDAIQARNNARRELVDMLNAGWFEDSDFEIIELVNTDGQTEPYYNNTQEGESNE